MSKQTNKYVREHADFTNKYTPDSNIGNQSSHTDMMILLIFPTPHLHHIPKCPLMTVRPSLLLLQHLPDTVPLFEVLQKQWKRRCSLAKM